MFIIICLINMGVISAAVLIHYETLFSLAKLLPRLGNPRHRVLVALVGVLIAHTVEIWIFSVAYYLLNANGSFGELTGNFSNTLLDCAYFSFTVYTSLGFGDIVPLGDLRFLCGLESLIGLVMIAWSASFMYLEMQKNWGDLR
ncbi:potassium channel family protein [Zhongshania arctica]|uniref:Potassium channel family protein n=1 Tax=Zhongshania arctica TaxID=3238302 RepID=A0ABV3U0P9_9GAMM